MNEQLIIRTSGGVAGGVGFSTNGNGYSFPAVTLSNATGNEVAYQLDYTTNKATSGNDTGFVINQTDTLSPGTSFIQTWQVAGVDKVSITNAGSIISSLTGTSSIFNLSTTGTTLSIQGTSITLHNTAGASAVAIISSQVVLHTDRLLGFSPGNGAADIFIAPTGTLAASNRTLVHSGLTAIHSDVSLTADVGSIQGGTPLIANINEISTCANIGDSVTLPPAMVDYSYNITIINNGANACDVFPASGDNLGAGANVAASLAAGADITYTSYDATNWFVKT